MVKYFLILLLACSTLFASGQDTLVQIKPSTARYYLEVEDEVFVLREKDSISNELIYNQSVMLDMKDRIIQTYKSDSIIYQSREKALNDHIDLVREQLIQADKEVKKQKLLKILIIGASLGLVLLL